MNRTGKQLFFSSIYLLILLLIAGGIYFFYLGPAPSCTDNKQNQGESGIDCGGSCVPCEVKDLSPVSEEVKFFLAGKNQATLLAKVKNPSRNFSANFSYEFNLGGSLSNQRELRGKETLAPERVEYIVVPGVPVDAGNIKSINLDITELNWSENKNSTSNIRVDGESKIDKTRVTVFGVLSNGSAANLPTVKLTALLKDREGKIINASVTRLEKVEAFSQRQFIIFFPEIEGLAENLNPQKTEVQWEVDE